MRPFLSPLVIALLAAGCSDQYGSPEFTATYIANCGFLLEANGRKVIIDGLLAGPTGDYYYLPTDNVTELMRTAKAPFDEIDLILVTHTHRDHFDASVAASHMAYNTGAILIGPPQVEEKLSVTEPHLQIKERLRIVPARADSVTTLTFDGIQVDALPSEHLPFWDLDTLTGQNVNIHADVDHLEYVIRMGDRVIYHSGDAGLNDVARYHRFGFGDTTIFLAMVGWWDERDQITFTQKLIRDVIRPERIIMMHMFLNRPPRGEPESQTLVAPQVYLPDSLMQSWRFE